MTVLPFAFPRTIDWLERRLDLRARLELRTVLRRVERASDARLVVLWAVENNVKTSVIELAGDDEALPRSLPPLTSSVPSREMTRDRHGEDHDTVIQKVRLGGDVPTLGAAIVAAGVEDGPGLFDAIEQVGEQVERIVVKAVERTDRARAIRDQKDVAAERARRRERGG